MKKVLPLPVSRDEVLNSRTITARKKLSRGEEDAAIVCISSTNKTKEVRRVSGGYSPLQFSALDDRTTQPYGLPWLTFFFDDKLLPETSSLLYPRTQTVRPRRVEKESPACGPQTLANQASSRGGRANLQKQSEEKLILTAPRFRIPGNPDSNWREKPGRKIGTRGG